MQFSFIWVLCSSLGLWSLLVSVVWVLSVCLFCSRPTSVGAAPICANAQTGCHILSLANLFDRVIQHSARMHGVSNDLHSEFVGLLKLFSDHPFLMVFQNYV